MKIWRKKAEKESSRRGVPRPSLNGASRKELLQEALKVLAQQAPTCRICFWLAVDSNASPHNDASSEFHGMVWDRCNSETPHEWSSLSLEPPLPEELLLRGKTVE